VTRRRTAVTVAVLAVIAAAGGWSFTHLTDSPASTPGASSTGLAGPGPSPSSADGLRAVHSPSKVATDLQLQAGQCHVHVIDGQSGLVLPDPACTPGAIDPAVTQQNLASTICRSGYTATIRPPASNTGAFKHESLLQYGMAYSRTAEYDHLVSLELGGTNSVSNLWPEPNRAGAKGVNNPKDLVENHLNQAVCTGKVTLAAAQQAIAHDWTTAEQALGLPTTYQR